MYRLLSGFPLAIVSFFQEMGDNGSVMKTAAGQSIKRFSLYLMGKVFVSVNNG
jgi:hypothetical protein